MIRQDILKFMVAILCSQGSMAAYLNVRAYIKWQQARLCCSKLGMSLLQVEDVTKFNDVADYISHIATADKKVWIGLQFDEDVQLFRWLDGSLYNYWKDVALSLPNTTYGYVEMAKINGTYKFVSIAESEAREYICEGRIPETVKTDYCNRPFITEPVIDDNEAGNNHLRSKIKVGAFGTAGFLKSLYAKFLEDCSAICLRTTGCRRTSYVVGTKNGVCRLYGMP